VQRELGSNNQRDHFAEKKESKQFWLSPAKKFFRRVTHHTRLKDMKQDSLFKITEL
jgi:hypothetical protein